MAVANGVSAHGAPLLTDSMTVRCCFLKEIKNTVSADAYNIVANAESKLHLYKHLNICNNVCFYIFSISWFNSCVHVL